MRRIIVDEEMLSQLHNLTKTLELCDESGKVLGHIYPVVDTPMIVSEGPRIGQEELRSGNQSEK